MSEATPEPTSSPEKPDYGRMGGADPSRLVYRGLPKGGWRDAYHALLTMPFFAFLGVMGGGYLAINALFAGIYLLTGGIAGARPGNFGDVFFFSVQTVGTLGYGGMSPKTLPANIAVTVEVFVGLFNLAVATGLLFARISRPTSRVMFSNRAVIEDFEGVPTLIFRAANQRRNRIVEAEVSVSLLRDQHTLEGRTIRRFEPLPTLRPMTPIFFLSWQIMHPIKEGSPLHGETRESLLASHAEIVVVVKGLDETFVQTVHARTSYTPDEIVWGGRLKDIFERTPDGRRVIDFTHFHDIV